MVLNASRLPHLQDLFDANREKENMTVAIAELRFGLDQEKRPTPHFYFLEYFDS